ncbi:MAG TPA: DNA/RNA non-specific endonuclease [Ferruginibacter sp.]|jgi:endonuclease G|nr:DNA/RNA non-specific endonuclease [Ferruginibacter sp.]
MANTIIKSSKTIIVLFFLLLVFKVEAQEVDDIISNDIYTSYFNHQLHEPLYVVYKLYEAGGNCKRKGMHFKTGGLEYSAKAKDYKGSGYDEGHLADAKDFAYDYDKEEETFRFYNCVPQTKVLNRGIWKHWETETRKESQNDSLLIICGSIFGNRTMGEDNIGIPDYCWKIVESLTTHEIIYCLIFPNDDSDTYSNISIEDLKQRLNYTIKL